MPQETQPQRSGHGDYCWCDACTESRKREQPPATDDKITGLHKFIDESTGKIATYDKQWTLSKVISMIGHPKDNFEIRGAAEVILAAHKAELESAENAEVQRLRDLAMEVQELKRQLASERGPLRELAETAAFDRAVGLTNKLHVEPLKQQLLQAQAAIAEARRLIENDISRRPALRCLESVDLSALERHNAKVRSHGWNEGREHERKCAEAVRKPMVDAIKRAVRSLRFDCPSFVAGEIANDLEAAIADAKTASA